MVYYTFMDKCLTPFMTNILYHFHALFRSAQMGALLRNYYVCNLQDCTQSYCW